MKTINKFSIKIKFGILFGILCLSILLLGYTSIKISESSKEKLKNVHTKSQKALLLQDKLISPLYDLRETTQSLVMAPNYKIRVKIEKKLEQVIKKLDNAFLIYENSKIYQQWNQYKKLIEKTNKYLQDGFEEGAYVNLTIPSKEQFDALVYELLQRQTKSLNNSTTAYESAVEDAKVLKIKIITYLASILFLSLLVGLLVSANVIKSIKSVQDGLNDFFEYLNNKKEKAKKIEINSNDEFSDMADVINKNVYLIQKNVEKDRALIKNATKVLENIKGGNLGTRLTKETNSEVLDELKYKINDMIDNLESRIEDELDKRMEQEKILIQQSKLASMGEMIGNIAHQWRQPIAQVSAIFMNMKVTYQFNKFTKEYMDEKIDEGNKLTSYMSQTISDFQNFFNPQGKKELFSIEKACKEAYFIVESSLKYHGVTTDFNIIEDNRIFGYKNEYSQVILNVLSNAKDILLERKIENPHIDIEIKSGDDYAIVKIHDNAGGIKKELLEKIFEPYFTTKHKVQGTGIGLYMSKNIIEKNMKGYINAINKNEGACFSIKIPKSNT
jgi:C4-dicarboxylate-specific signal transduction histidine kinase